MFIKKFYNFGKNKLYPLHRSITGDGVRKSLQLIKKNFPRLKIFEIPSGTKVFDWTIPPEWNVNEAYIRDKYNKKIIDFKKNNLHLVAYSIPMNKVLKKEKLFNHLHSLPKQPRAIPYITSFYKKYWGFCISDHEKKILNKKYKNSDRFKVVIKSNFKKKGSMTYGEILIPGKSKQEILISTCICHPAMANNEISGPIVLLCLIKYFQQLKNLEKTLRFIFIPETIGSITYLNKKLEHLKKNVIGGYQLVCIGDERQYSCMLSKYGKTQSDLAIIESFKKLKIKYKKYSFLERGSDERQYNSPNIDLPIASIFRSKYGEYDEYHTSLDDFNLVTEKGIRGGFKVAQTAIKILLKKKIPQNIILCEPQLSRRNLYPSLSNFRSNPKQLDRYKYTFNVVNFLQYADGKNDLMEISKLIKLSYNETLKLHKVLLKKKLIIS